jgi:hypothetical protein
MLREDADKLMSVLQAGTEAGMSSGDWVVFVGPEGGYQMIAGYGGTLESLQWDKGATRAWSVGRRGSRLVVEGRTSTDRCRIESAAPNQQARTMVGQAALYRI